MLAAAVVALHGGPRLGREASLWGTSGVREVDVPWATPWEQHADGGGNSGTLVGRSLEKP